MTRRRLLLIDGTLAACVMALAVLAMLPARPGVTKANFDRIENGMTRIEVEEMFGETGKIVGDHVVVLRYGISAKKGGDTVLYWEVSNRSWAYVVLLEDCVIHKYWIRHDASNENILDKLRRWLHL